MAQSMFDILEQGKIEIDHKGEKGFFNLPEWVKELALIIEKEDKLLEWAKAHEVVLPVFHYFVKQLFIALRAAARPGTKIYVDITQARATGDQGRIDQSIQLLMKDLETLCHNTKTTKDDWWINKKTGELSMRIMNDPNAQNRIDEFILKATQRPGTVAGVAGKIKAADRAALVRMAQAMKDTGLDSSVIKTTLTNASDNIEAALIMNELV